MLDFLKVAGTGFIPLLLCIAEWARIWVALQRKPIQGIGSLFWIASCCEQHLLQNNKPVVFTTGFLCRANRKNVEPNTIRIREILIIKNDLVKHPHLKKV